MSYRATPPRCVQRDAARAVALAHHPSHTAEANNWGRAKVLQKQDTPLDAALTVAHAVWHVAGALPGGRPKKRALTRSLRDLTPVREMGKGKQRVSELTLPHPIVVEDWP